MARRSKPEKGKTAMDGRTPGEFLDLGDARSYHPPERGNALPGKKGFKMEKRRFVVLSCLVFMALAGLAGCDGENVVEKAKSYAFGISFGKGGGETAPLAPTEAAPEKPVAVEPAPGEFPEPKSLSLGFKRTYRAVFEDRGMAAFEYRDGDGRIVSIQVQGVRQDGNAEIREALADLIMSERGLCASHERDGDVFLCRSHALRGGDEYQAFMGRRLTDRFIAVGELVVKGKDDPFVGRFGK